VDVYVYYVVCQCWTKNNVTSIASRLWHQGVCGCCIY